ncbi:uncharacterized protein RB166_004581 [Leptodactylus fuscus]
MPCVGECGPFLGYVSNYEQGQYIIFTAHWVNVLSSISLNPETSKDRKLPDTFNEAQYITFSMLVFCSVWIAFIMAYLSTKGKYMVAVVVFTIEVSNILKMASRLYMHFSQYTIKPTLLVLQQQNGLPHIGCYETFPPFGNPPSICWTDCHFISQGMNNVIPLINILEKMLVNLAGHGNRDMVPTSHSHKSPVVAELEEKEDIGGQAMCNKMGSFSTQVTGKEEQQQLEEEKGDKEDEAKNPDTPCLTRSLSIHFALLWLLWEVWGRSRISSISSSLSSLGLDGEPEGDCIIRRLSRIAACMCEDKIKRTKSRIRARPPEDSRPAASSLQDLMDTRCNIDFIGEVNNVAEPADLIIGGILQISANDITPIDYTNTKEEYVKCDTYILLLFLRHLLVFIFAIEEINRRSDILPNITLGYNIYDSCILEHKAVHSVLSILSGGEDAVPNYNCDEKNNVVAFIGHLASSPSLSIAEIAGLYGYPQTPKSVCTPRCLHGYRKIPLEGQQRCCYYCVPCSEGEISNETDMETCLTCSEYQWSNERRDTCIPRTIDFLSYEETLGLSLVVIAVVFCLLTAVILGIFIKYKDTAIVKANNQNLSFILLLSLILSFLCPFLFIGRPTRMSCLLRQVAFGNIFTIAVSSILVKTITVVLAFKATKPNTSMRRWLGRHFSTCLLIIFSSIEVFICVIWLSLSPPFPYQNSKVEIGKIILQCDEGSVIGFYISLGYMGFLAVLSFVVAFLARKLPDTFNEAQYITFSMLVFCSVWIAFIMAYLSTKGKYMVAVVVFTIEVSSAGLLVCIFFPKFYIILLRPELNVKGNLIVQIKHNVI